MALTRLSGQFIKSGSIPTSALGGGVVSSSAQASTWTVASASYALTASYVSGAASTWETLQNKPSGLVSSSTQASTWSVATASYVNTLNQSVSASGYIAAGGNLISNNSSGDEGGEILLAKPQTNTTLDGTGVTIDVYRNKLRIFEQGGTARGGYYDITTLGAGVATNLAGGSGTVTSVTAGSGLTGGEITGVGTITVDTGSAHFITGSVNNVLNAKSVFSSSSQVSYTGLSNIPSGIVSSSTQLALDIFNPFLLAGM